MKIRSGSFDAETASQVGMEAENPDIFGEEYRVLAVESQSLTVQGVRSGKVLTIVNPAVPLSPEEYPPGKLITLSDPSGSDPN
ncbi:MAG TPA: hypothetical protein VHW45_01985 [Candidatus Sulfotelmatobacter sp.]|jgi:hypothetical protein|nr:hypothetical protein [Candidatus Sulfotelmatobacter sp.]